jgi:hypothetical protein
MKPVNPLATSATNTRKSNSWLQAGCGPRGLSPLLVRTGLWNAAEK